MGIDRVDSAAAVLETRRSRRQSGLTGPIPVSTGSSRPESGEQPVVRSGRRAATGEQPVVRSGRRAATGEQPVVWSGRRAATGEQPAVPERRSVLRYWSPRIALLGVLATITVVLPLTGNVSPGNGTFVAGAMAAEANAPGTLDVLMNVAVATVPPPAIAASAANATRAEIAANRSEVRTPLPGCNDAVRPAGANGQLRTSDLCTLWDGTHQLRGDAASSLAELDLAFRARFGRDLCIENAYRTLAEQRVLKVIKGGLAAVPGRSNHGWGLAVDLCSNETSGAGWTWLKANGAVYGWENPVWALVGGSGPHEPWHWEYARGVVADGEYYTS